MPHPSSTVSSESTPLLSQSDPHSGHAELQQPSRKVADEECDKKDLAPVSWASLPEKGQLAIMVFARLAEPLSERSLTSYLFYQLRWFDPSLGAAEIAKQAGQITAIFAAAQCLTSMWWGHAADSAFFGRKRVLLIGLLGTSLSALGMGFSTSLHTAFFFRFVAGALNGNIGVLRTMVSEVIVDKRYQSRAFLLLPMCFNVGVIIGPLMSGFLADPVRSLPSIFGPGSFLGGADGVEWMRRFPYALPNLVCASILLTAALAILLGLDETHPLVRHRPDHGRRIGKLLFAKLTRRQEQHHSYEPLITQQTALVLAAPRSGEMEQSRSQILLENKPPFKAIFTKNVTLTLLQHFFKAIHGSAFNAVFFVLLPTPRADNTHATLPFWFTGGLGLSSKKVGLVNTIIGVIGIPLQIFVYPRVNARLGVLTSYRLFLPLSILAYCMIPYLILLPNRDGPVWVCLTILLSLHVISRVFITPATMILVNESSPSPTLLGTVHGFASSISSGARIFGPTLGGAVLSWGLDHNIVGTPLWAMSIVAAANWFILFHIKDATKAR